MLNRLQELEVELEQERRNCEVKMKLLDDEHEKEKAEIKEDFATALQVNNFFEEKDNKSKSSRGTQGSRVTAIKWMGQNKN